MSSGSIFTIIEQAIAIIFSIGVLYLLRIWMVRNLEYEDRGKVRLEIARKVRLSAFQRSVEILQSDDSLEGHQLGENASLEVQDGIG
jgi:hypothetical protein